MRKSLLGLLVFAVSLLGSGCGAPVVSRGGFAVRLARRRDRGGTAQRKRASQSGPIPAYEYAQSGGAEAFRFIRYGRFRILRQALCREPPLDNGRVWPSLRNRHVVWGDDQLPRRAPTNRCPSDQRDDGGSVAANYFGRPSHTAGHSIDTIARRHKFSLLCVFHRGTYNRVCVSYPASLCLRSCEGVCRETYPYSVPLYR